MSGKPNTEGIKELKREFLHLKAVQDDLCEANKQLKDAHDRVEHFRFAESETTCRIEKLLQQMDVNSPGNAGYEGRMFSLLAGLSISELKP